MDQMDKIKEIPTVLVKLIKEEMKYKDPTTICKFCRNSFEFGQKFICKCNKALWIEVDANGWCDYHEQERKNTSDEDK